MHRAQWIIGSCLAVAAGSALPTVLCFVWLSGISHSDGMEGILCIFAATIGTLVGFVVSLSAVLVLARRSEKRAGRSATGPALIGGLLPVVLLVLGLLSYGAITDFRDKTERAEAELADFLTEVAPALPAREETWVQRWDLSDAASECEVGTRWWDSRLIELGDDAVESISYLHRQLTDRGWLVEFTRVADPLDTYEVWVLAAAKGDRYVDARTELRPADATLSLMMMVGPCVEEDGWRLVQTASEPGVSLEPSFAAPTFAGLERTDIDAALWAPRVLDRNGFSVSECERDNRPATSDVQRIWSDNASADHLHYVDDPHADAVRWLADMQEALEVDGWETVYMRKRNAVTDHHDEREERRLWANKGKSFVELEASMSLTGGGGRLSVVEVRTLHGQCVGDRGIDLRDRSWFLGGRVIDPLHFDPLKRRSS